MQRQLMTLPDHEFQYSGNNNYKVKCNLTTGEFYTRVWTLGKVSYYECPCCGGKCKK